MKTKDARLYLQSGTIFVYSFYHAVMIYVDFQFERDLKSPWRQNLWACLLGKTHAKCECQHSMGWGSGLYKRKQNKQMNKNHENQHSHLSIF